MNTWESDDDGDRPGVFHSLTPADFGEDGWLFTIRCETAAEAKRLLERWGPT